MEKLRLLETVVVEGRDDEAAVLRAVDAAVISTHGWGLPDGNVERIRESPFARLCQVVPALVSDVASLIVIVAYIY